MFKTDLSSLLSANPWKPRVVAKQRKTLDGALNDCSLSTTVHQNSLAECAEFFSFIYNKELFCEFIL